MAQREVECKDDASPLFCINDIAADECHADSNAIDRRNGVNDNNEENCCKNNANNNDEIHVKNGHYGDKDKARSLGDDMSSGSLAKGSGVVGKNTLPLISQQVGGDPSLPHPARVVRRNVPLQPCHGSWRVVYNYFIGD